MKIFLYFLALAIGVQISLYADEPSVVSQVTDGWRGSITPYVWLPSISAHAYYDNQLVSQANIGGNTLLKDMNMGGMLMGEAHYGNWGAMGNVFFANVNSTMTKPINLAFNLSATSNVSTGIYNAAGTYSLYSSGNFYLDALVGMRFITLNTTTNFNVPINANGASSLSVNSNVSYLIAGLKGKVKFFDSHFFAPFYIDVGSGSSNVKRTTQEILGVGYSFSWGDVSLVYNNLYFTLNQSGSTAHMNMGGPALGVTFRF